MDEVIELNIPPLAELMALVRFTAATLGARAAFSVEEVEDLRLAANELCAPVLSKSAPRQIRLRYVLSGDTIEISCTSDGVVRSEPEVSYPDGDWSRRILDALVNEHGREDGFGQQRSWLRKRRSRSTV